MVSGTLKVGRLFGWHIIFEYDVEGDGDIIINYYLPDGKTMLKIRLDAGSKAALKTKRDQIIALMQADITLGGAILERWELQTVTEPAKTVEKWVQTA